MVIQRFAIVWTIGKISSCLILPTSSCEQWTTLLRQRQIAHPVTIKIARISSFLQLWWSKECREFLNERTDSNLELDIPHHAQTFRHNTSIVVHLKKQWCKSSTSKPQKTHATVDKRIPRCCKLTLVGRALFNRRQINKLTFSGMRELQNFGHSPIKLTFSVT